MDLSLFLLQEVIASRQRFPKPSERYRSLLFFGKNIVASEGEDWKKYRKVIGPLFSEPNNRLVWDEAVAILNDLFLNVWSKQKEIVSDHALEITMPVGFFFRVHWNSADENVS